MIRHALKLSTNFIIFPPHIIKMVIEVFSIYGAIQISRLSWVILIGHWYYPIIIFESFSPRFYLSKYLFD